MNKGVIAEKRGLSPVIASVLLILLVLVLAALIFLWARGFISEQIEKFGQPIANLCESVDFDVELITVDAYTNSYSLEVINRGNVNIFHLDIKKYKDGNSETGKFSYAIDAGKSRNEEVNIMMEGDIKPDKISIYPALIGNVRGRDSNKAVVCNENGIDIEIN